MSATPLIARLFDSVAPLVQTIAVAVSPLSSAATCTRAWSTAASAAQAERVPAAGGVAEDFHEERAHRLKHARVDGGGGVVVEINRQLDAHRGLLRSVGIVTSFGRQSSENFATGAT